MNRRNEEMYGGVVKRKKNKDSMKFMFGSFAFLLIIFAILSVYVVPVGHRGVLTTFGKPTMRSIPEGLGFKIPIAQTVKNIEVRTQKLESLADSASLDLQDVQTTIAFNYHINKFAVANLYVEIGGEYRNRIIEPAIQEVVKQVTARYKAEELITKRPNVTQDMKNAISEKVKTYYVEVDSFNIVNFQFSEEFDKAIEQKVTAEQLKLKAERDLERIIIEKEQQITQAEGEAEALRLQRDVVTPELVKLRQIEMMISAIDKWDGKLPDATSGMPFIDISPRSLESD